VEGDPRIGTTLAGFEIEERLGHGGMGVVYRARERHPDRAIALKVLPAELACDTDYRQRFERESHLAALIEHPSIVPIYQSGEADGLLFLAMRYIEGVDLRTLVAASGPLEPGRAVDLLGQVASALDAAHARGLVHRDVKPENVLVADSPLSDEPEQAFLTDFGIAKLSASGAELTKKGSFLGTPYFAAPEQFEGNELDGRTDIYALTGLLVYALTGEEPFPRRDAVAVMCAHLLEPAPSATARQPALPPAIDAVIAKGMAKQAADRYASCRELVAAARDALAVRLGPKPAAAERAARRARWHSRRLAVVTLGLVLAAAGAAGAVIATAGSGGNGAPVASAAVPARLQGTWNLTLTVTYLEHVLNEQVGQRYTQTWTVTPVCAQGICAATVRRAGRGSFTLIPIKGGRSYTGTARFTGLYTCDNGKDYPKGSEYTTVWTVNVARTVQSNGRLATRVTGREVTTGVSKTIPGCTKIHSREVATLVGVRRSGQT
jgi:serine/threonine-protein kinase